MKYSIPLKKVHNARELGGYPVSDGRRVRNGVLLRTANLNEISSEDIKTLTEKYHLSSIIDFRMDMEIMDYADPVINGVKNYHLNVIDISALAAEYPQVDINSLDLYRLVELSESMGMLNEKMYIGFLSQKSGIKAYTKFFRILLETEPDRAVLWHCTSGKDRTGLASMLLLSALGADEKVILEDYMLTNEFNARRIEGTRQALKANGLEDIYINKAILVFDSVDISYMENTLEFLNKKYGSVLGYIRTELKVSDDEISKLKEKYLV